MNEINEAPTSADIGDFDAIIKDGKMVITPADAGVRLFAYIKMVEEQIRIADDFTKTAEDKVEFLRQENADFRELLDTVYPILMLAGHVELAQKILGKQYPSNKTWDDGTTKRYIL